MMWPVLLAAKAGASILLREPPTWSTEPVHPQKFIRNAVEIPRYVGIENRMVASAQDVISRLYRNDIGKAEAMANFKQALKQAETEAFVAGRRARGDLRSGLSEAEARMLTGRHSRNMRYFSNFCDDVLDGRGRMSYSRRAEMYGKSLWSLYTRGETSDFDDEAARARRYGWVLDPDVEHCRSCLDRAKLSRDQGGLTWDDLIEIGWPGENTLCGPYCRCHIEVIAKSAPRSRTTPPPVKADTPETGLKVFESILGGPNLPFDLPVAGAPFVAFAPNIVPRSLAVAESAAETMDSVIDGDELLRMLPTVPHTLVSPTEIISTAPNQRTYVGDDVAIVTERRYGQWCAILILQMAQLVEEASRAGDRAA